MKNKFLNVVLIFSLFVGLFAGGWFIVKTNSAHDEFTQNIEIETEGQTSKVLEFSKLNLKPGDKCQYTINLVCELEGDYKIILEFKDRGGELKKFVNVSVDLQGKNLASQGLDQIFGAQKIETQATLTADEPEKLLIGYELPLTVGNEAQGAVADFEVIVTIESMSEVL